MIFLVIISAMIIACKKPKGDSIVAVAKPDYMTFSTSLRDTLDSKTIKTLAVLESTTGVKVKYQSGEERRYFRYRADWKQLAKAFREMSFGIENYRTDVDLRSVSIEQITTASDYSPDEAPDFWSEFTADYKSFECVKNGIKHQILFNSTTRQVLHRVVYG